MGINHLKDGKREGDAAPEGNFQLLHKVNEIWLEINPVEFRGVRGAGGGYFNSWLYRFGHEKCGRVQ